MFFFIKPTLIRTVVHNNKTWFSDPPQQAYCCVRALYVFTIKHAEGKSIVESIICVCVDNSKRTAEMQALAR